MSPSQVCGGRAITTSYFQDVVWKSPGRKRTCPGHGSIRCAPRWLQFRGQGKEGFSPMPWAHWCSQTSYFVLPDVSFRHPPRKKQNTQNKTKPTPTPNLKSVVTQFKAHTLVTLPVIIHSAARALQTLTDGTQRGASGAQFRTHPHRQHEDKRARSSALFFLTMEVTWHSSPGPTLRHNYARQKRKAV